jgi:hypothetical protein
VVREGWGQGGEMTQALCAHMNNNNKKKGGGDVASKDPGKLKSAHQPH